jgi:hypothetical protein
MNLTRLFYDFIVVVFSTLISVVVPDVISQCNSKASFPKFLELPGFFLHVIPMAPASQVLNHMECGRTCFFQTGCVSYNFKHGVSGGTNCEILANDRFLNSSALRRDSKYSYYYVQVYIKWHLKNEFFFFFKCFNGLWEYQDNEGKRRLSLRGHVTQFPLNKVRP